jgi:hypothetical protein
MNWGKSRNRSEGGYGRIFIGLRRVVVGRVVQNGGRDVELLVAVASSCASTVAKKETTLSSPLSARNGTRAGVGLRSGDGVGLLCGLLLDRGGPRGKPPFFLNFIFCFLFLFCISVLNFLF